MQSFRRGPNARVTVLLLKMLARSQPVFMYLGLEANNRKVHRFGRTHRIEILTEKYDLAVGGTQKDYVILSIDAPSRFDDTLRFDLADCACRIFKGMDREVEEAEIVHRSSEPGNVADYLFSSR